MNCPTWVRNYDIESIVPNYNEPVSDDTPCLELPIDRKEKKWLAMHIGCQLRLVKMEGGILVEDLTCDAFLIATEPIK